VNWPLVEHIRRLPAVEKNKIAAARAGLLGVWRAIWDDNQPR
jgi:hypothetical protein